MTMNVCHTLLKHSGQPKVLFEKLLLAFATIFIIANVEEARAQRNFTPQMASAFNFINVTSHGAIPNDSGDDTTAIQNAIKAARGVDTIYFPNGTYIVSNTLEWKNSANAWRAFVNFQGQSRSGTIIRLRNSCPGFTNASTPKAVIKTASQNSDGDGTGNQAFNNSIYDLTLDVGSGNHGAIGIDYMANNRGVIQNVSIRSSDASRVGVAGISMKRSWPGPCLIRDVSIVGFNLGIDMGTWEYGATIENLSLSGQRSYGIRNQNNMLAIRKLSSSNSVPVIQNLRDGGGARIGLVTLVDANLTNGAGSSPAIINDALMFARNINTTGYANAIRNQGAGVGGNWAFIGEWASDYVVGSTGTSLNLPVEETPTYFDTSFANWRSVGAPNGSDDTSRIQQAMDSGASVIYFPAGDYRIRDTIRIRGNVRHIFCSDSSFFPSWNHTFTDSANVKPVFQFDTGNGDSVLMERFRVEFWDVYGARAVENASGKKVALKDANFHAAGGSYRGFWGAGKLYIENVESGGGHSGRNFGWYFMAPQTVWARQFDPETSQYPMVYSTNGSTIWILGLKTEVPQTVMNTDTGGRTEILGGLIYPTAFHWGPIFTDVDSTASYSFVVRGSNSYDMFLESRKNGVMKRVHRRDAINDGVPFFRGF
jgi:hypothetical protein